jgi:hypothetical protein
MSSTLIRCPNCNTPLPADHLNVTAFTDCPRCNVPVRAVVYPSFFRRPDTANPGEPLIIDTGSSCFFHPKKKAVVPCQLCGRFLCSLCDIDFNGQHLCSSCIDAGKKKRKIRNLENNRVLYDSIALYLAVIPMLLIWPTILTAPASIFYSVRHWKSPSGIIPRSKARFVIAMCIAGLQLGGWSLALSHLLL